MVVILVRVGYVPEGIRWVPADECKIFMYADKIYSDFKKSTTSSDYLVKIGYLTIKNIGFGRNFKVEIGLMAVIFLDSKQTVFYIGTFY